MDSHDSDVLVIFGVTGDLAYKKIFPALRALVARDSLTLLVVGVAGRSSDCASACWRAAPAQPYDN